jgi:putative FmdB family regulatory protein
VPIFDFNCSKCGLEFDKLTKQSINRVYCPICEGESFRVFPRKAPSIDLKYNPVTDKVDWDGNTSRYWDEYKKQKSEGKDVRIPKHDGDG